MVFRFIEQNKIAFLFFCVLYPVHVERLINRRRLAADRIIAEAQNDRIADDPVRRIVQMFEFVRIDQRHALRRRRNGHILVLRIADLLDLLLAARFREQPSRILVVRADEHLYVAVAPDRRRHFAPVLIVELIKVLYDRQHKDPARTSDRHDAVHFVELRQIAELVHYEIDVAQQLLRVRFSQLLIARRLFDERFIHLRDKQGNELIAVFLLVRDLQK